MLRPGVPLAEVARRCEDVFTATAYVRRHGLRPPPRPTSAATAYVRRHGLRPPPRPTSAATAGRVGGMGSGSPSSRPGSSRPPGGVVEPGLCLALERRIEASGLGGASYEDNIIWVEGSVHDIQ